MAKTFTEQCELVDFTWGGDSEGVHSFVPFDYVRYVNNLATYCNNHAHFFHGASDSSGSNYRLTVGVDTASEAFMCQIPVCVPTWAARMLWTAGVTDDGFGGSSVTAATVYISPFPYTGAGSDNGSNVGPFDVLNLTHGYKSSTVSVSTAGAHYRLADDSVTGILAPTDQSFQHDETFAKKLVTYAIITLTTGADNVGAVLCDFTCWFTPL